MSEVEAPQIFKHGLALYNELASTAIDGHFHGSMVQAFRNTGASSSHYSRLFRTLEGTGCIKTVVAARGGGGRKSEIILLRPPEPEDFPHVTVKPLTPRIDFDSLVERISSLEGRLPEGVDFVSLLYNFEMRLRILELREVHGTPSQVTE